jgi:hypothetical protein
MLKIILNHCTIDDFNHLKTPPERGLSFLASPARFFRHGVWQSPWAKVWGLRPQVLVQVPTLALLSRNQTG